MNVMEKSNKSKPIFTAFIVAIIAITIVQALSAGVVNPDYVAGFNWVNSSVGINTMNVFINDTNYTANIISGVGAGNLTVRVNGGADVGTQGRLNLIEGDGISITATDDPANNEIDIEFNSTASGNGNYTTVEDNGAEIGTRQRLNFIEGDNISLTIADDAANNEVDITITSTAGGGAESVGTVNNSYSPYDYRVVLDGSNWLAINKTGGIDFNDTVAYNTIQGAINISTQDVGGNEVWDRVSRVKSTGSMLLPAEEIPLGANNLLLPNHYMLHGVGQATVIQYTGNYGIIPMWSNFTYDVQVFNLMIEGDGGGGTYGIYWYGTGSNNLTENTDYYSWWVNFDTLYIRSSNTMIYLRSTGGEHTIARINAIRGTGNMWLQRINDGSFVNIDCSTADWYNVVTCNFDDWYIGSGNLDIGGGTQPFPVKGNTMSNIRSDNTLNSPSLRVTGHFTENVLTGWQYANARQGTGDNTEDCIRFEGNATYNSITGSFIGNYPSRANRDTWRYGIYFSVDSHNNTLKGNTYMFDQIDSAIIYEENVGSNNIENRRQTYYGGATETIGAVSEYVPIIGVYATTGSMSGRCTMHDISGYWGNVQVGRTAGVPAGEWQSVFLSNENYNAIGGITDQLEVNITAGNDWGVNTSWVHIDVGNYPDLFAYNIESKDATCTGVTHMIIEFLPDLDEWYRNP